MSAAFGRDALLDAFDKIGRAADVSARRHSGRPCGFSSVGRIFACAQVKGIPDYGPTARGSRAARYSQFDAGRWDFVYRGCHNFARPILPNECFIFRETAVSIEEHE